MNPEINVLGAILLDEDGCSFVFEQLEPEHFTHPLRIETFEIMGKIRKEGKEITVLTVSEYGKQYMDFCIELSATIVSTVGLKSHIGMMLDTHYRKVLINKSEELKQKAHEVTVPVSDLLGMVEDMALTLSDRVSDKGLEHISKVGPRVAQDLDEIAKGKVAGVPTGFDKLDSNGFVFRKKTLNIVAGRPGTGKTALALCVARNAGVNTAIFSAEMASEELYERMISIETKMTNDYLRDGSAIKQFPQNIAKAMCKIDQNKIWIDDCVNRSPLQIISQCKRLQAREGLGLIIVDYLQLLRVKGIKKRIDEVSEVSKTLKRAAKELGVPVVAMAQLNRSCEARPDKRPLLSDLKESGEIEQDAHMVWFIYRDEMYNEEARSGETEILIRKNRSGRTGKVIIHYEKEYTQFMDTDTSPKADW